MKIKKVSIQSFRLFENVTVNLSARKNPEKAANLVAIYAPNGFGKTSFFDAMEFCITKSINRVRTNFKENFTTDQKHGLTTFIHNKEFPKRPIEISMSFEDIEDIKMTCAPDDECNLLSESKIEHKYFRDAILSQDWLSDFLSTKSSIERFKIFTENFEETNRLLDYYKSLSKASKSFAIEISKKNKELRQLKKQIDTSLGVEILQQLNDASSKLNMPSFKTAVQENKDNSLQKQKLNYEKLIASLSVDYEKIEQDEYLVDRSRKGEDGCLDLENLEDFKREYDNIKVNLKHIAEKLKEIKEYKELLSQIDQSQSILNTLKNKKELYQYLIDGYNEYRSLQDKQNKFKKQKQELLFRREKDLTEINELNKSLEYLVNDIARTNELKQTNENALLQLQSRYKEVVKLRLLLKNTSDKLFSNEIEIEKKRNELKTKTLDLQNLVNFRNELGKNNISLVVGVFEDETKQLVELQDILCVKSEELANIERQISDKVEFEDVLQTLLSSSQNILQHLKEGKCPLCGFDYENYNVLLNHVNNNSVLSDTIKEDEKVKRIIESEIKDFQRQKKELINCLLAKIDDRYKNGHKEKEGISETINSLVSSSNKLEKDIFEKKQYLESSFEDLISVSEEEKRKFYEDVIFEYTNSLEQLKTKEKYLKTRKCNLDKKNEDLSKEILDASDKIIEIDNNEFFQKYKISLTDLKQTDDLSGEMFESWNTKLAQISFEEDETNKILREQHIKLGTFSAKEINLVNEIVHQQTYDSLTNQFNRMHGRYLKTIHFLEVQCNIRNLDNKEIDYSSIIKTYNTISFELRTRKKSIEDKIRNIKECVKILEIGERYINNERTKKDYDVLSSYLNKIQYNKGIVDSEKEKLQKYLNDFVSSFFKLDVINKLYNFIDPHPEYKKIQFECDFKYKDPRLNILMLSENENSESIVPNLYFSTAQINILAFSIFMAKALFTKTDTGNNLDCIFIDDPIQALDDINILSMIDLLRNIAFSLDKQIILTTHDKDFFELMKVKIPERLFNSRFIEFKERGILE